jgi:hypothetical protein
MNSSPLLSPVLSGHIDIRWYYWERTRLLLWGSNSVFISDPDLAELRKAKDRRTTMKAHMHDYIYWLTNRPRLHDGHATDTGPF